MKNDINYEDCIIKFNILGCSGFEQYPASYLIENYVTKYNTIWGVDSDNWNVSFWSIIKDITDSGNSDKTLGLFIQSVFMKLWNYN